MCAIDDSAGNLPKEDKIRRGKLRTWLIVCITLALLLTATPLALLGVAHAQEPPTITSVNPTQGIQGKTNLGVNIYGTNLITATAVSFGDGITVNSFGANSNTQIWVSISIAGSATPGTRNVTVTNPVSSATLTNGFTVMPGAPTITSVEPSQGIQAQPLEVWIFGTNLSTVTAVSIGEGITVNSFETLSNNVIHAFISIDSSATPGPRNVTVTNPVSSATLTDGFTVMPGAPTYMLAGSSAGKSDFTIGTIYLSGPLRPQTVAIRRVTWQ